MMAIRGFTCALTLFVIVMATAAQVRAEALDEADAGFRQHRKRLISSNLELSPAEAARFWPVYEEFEKDLFAITEARRAVIAKFGENYDSMTDEMARQLINDRLKVEEARYRVKRKFLPRFEKTLPIRKLARYYQIESKISASVEAGIAEELPLIK